MSTPSTTARVAPFRDILAYVTGDGVNSLVVNSMGFAMLYYTEALRLDHALAGLVISVAVFWNAVTEPVMGHISDNTRSRFGRRHPYMLFGGLFTVVCFFFLWAVPQSFRAPPVLFWYLIVLHLLLRTGITVFSVPHGALGFEVCTDYTQRTTLQGMRVVFNMLINLAGPAMAWAVFFKDRPGVESTSIASNYVRMGSVFSIAALAFVFLVVFATRKYVLDTRRLPEIVGNRPREVWRNIRDVLTDRCPRSVFLFTSIVFVGMAFVAFLQMYVYVHFMAFSSAQRAIVHGATMVAGGLGGVISPLLVRKVDKKAAVCIAAIVAAAASAMLLILLIPTCIPPGTVYCLPAGLPFLGGQTVPVAMLFFLTFHALYWAGNGVLTSVAGSMIADASEVCRYRTGVLKDGSYSAMLSCITKLSMSLGLVLAGCCLDWVGFVVGRETQTPQAVRNLAIVTFLAGAAAALVAMLTLLKYPVTQAYMCRLRETSTGPSDLQTRPDPGRPVGSGSAE